jgi:hypothetical protein
MKTAKQTRTTPVKAFFLSIFLAGKFIILPSWFRKKFDFRFSVIPAKAGIQSRSERD